MVQNPKYLSERKGEKVPRVPTPKFASARSMLRLDAAGFWKPGLWSDNLETSSLDSGVWTLDQERNSQCQPWPYTYVRGYIKAAAAAATVFSVR